jgi:predicted AlkP superfamily pyrophosphatase or phosphodiesterase
MINQASIAAVNASKLNEHFGKPLYDSYCFSQIPQVIYHVLTGEKTLGLPADVLGDLPRRYDKVILLFIDAFGWRFFEERAENYSFLKRFVDEGVVSKLTTQFPSTTAAHTTTIHTGLPVGESGVFEWFYYEPRVKAIIAPLLFSIAGEGRRGLLPREYAETIYPQHSLYQRLAQAGVKPTVYLHADYAHSPFSRAVCAGATVSAYQTLPEVLVNLTEAAIDEQEHAYFFLYFGDIDTVGHVHGPSSPHFDAEIHTFLASAERLLHARLSGKLKNTLLLITADHGQTDVSPKTAIYLNQQNLGIERLIKTNDDGKLLVPAGSARDMFLYIKEEHLDEAQHILSEHLAGRAEVYRTQDLIAQGLFGSGKPSETFLSRVGNLVILPYQHETVWWYEEGKFKQDFYGHHGGLLREEMETLLLALPYD